MKKDKIGTIDEFHSKSCYKLYIYAVSLAKQINEYIDKGYIVIEKGEIKTHKFIFHDCNSPCIATQDRHFTYVDIGNTYNIDGKVWLYGEETKKTIKERFDKFQIVNPVNIEKIKYK